MMTIYPAIDLLDGKCVRLAKGDFEQKTIYSENPLEMALSFENDGASALHLVDLSGAKNPASRQISIIEKIVKNTHLKIQCGGGIRTREEVVALLECGVDRVVLGSIAVTKPELVHGLLKEFGGKRITLAIDVIYQDHEYRVATQGWKNITSHSALELISIYQGSNVDRILCTDISKDGMMGGPNLMLYENLVNQFPGIDFQASGGMSKPKDIEDLEKVGVRSLVIGKALYEGSISLKEILKSESDRNHAH